MSTAPHSGPCLPGQCWSHRLKTEPAAVDLTFRGPLAILSPVKERTNVDKWNIWRILAMGISSKDRKLLFPMGLGVSCPSSTLSHFPNSNPHGPQFSYL